MQKLRAVAAPERQHDKVVVGKIAAKCSTFLEV
jgi:hypothetical protein